MIKTREGRGGGVVAYNKLDIKDEIKVNNKIDLILVKL